MMPFFVGSNLFPFVCLFLPSIFSRGSRGLFDLQREQGQNEGRHRKLGRDKTDENKVEIDEGKERRDRERGSLQRPSLPACLDFSLLFRPSSSSSPNVVVETLFIFIKVPMRKWPLRLAWQEGEL